MAEQPSGPSGNDQFFLGQIDANIKQLLEARLRDKEELRGEFRAVNIRIDAHGTRITTLERGYWKIAGIAVALTSIPLGVGLVGYIMKIAGAGNG